jgi:hypothetical protein
VILRAFLIPVAISGLALGQDDPQTSDPQAQAAPPPQAQPAPGPTVGEKARYDARRLADFENFVYAALGASVDQGRNRPSEWGQGGEAWGHRYASHLGQYVIQRSIMFPVQVIDHEDARYYRSKRTSFQGRFGDAFLHTIWRHDDSGGMMPAYSEFFGDYGAAALSRLWWPQRFHNGRAIFIAGSDTLLIDAGINLVREFRPNVKRWLRRKLGAVR